MRDEIFSAIGSELSFADDADLMRQLGQIDSSVPGRTKGRRSHDRERFDIVRYLRALSRLSCLTYPLRVIKSESPDFLLHMADSSVIALEVTEAGTERHQRALTQLEKSPPGTFLEGEEGLRLPGESYRISPYYGNEGELEFSELVVQALKKKTSTLNAPHFQPASRYDILIHDNSHCTPSRWKLGPILKTAFSEWQRENQTERSFTIISVIWSSQLLYDCTGRSLLIEDLE